MLIKSKGQNSVFGFERASRQLGNFCPHPRRLAPFSSMKKGPVSNEIFGCKSSKVLAFQKVPILFHIPYEPETLPKKNYHEIRTFYFIIPPIHFKCWSPLNNFGIFFRGQIGSKFDQLFMLIRRFNSQR